MQNLNTVLSGFYARDIEKLIEEIKSFNNEEDIWKITGTIRNSAGNLTLHIIGGSNHLIGGQLAKTDYVRERDKEFTATDVPREDLIKGLEELKEMITGTISDFQSNDFENDFPIPFDDANNSIGYVLIQLLAHLNYHLGQINYLRRALNQNSQKFKITIV